MKGMKKFLTGILAASMALSITMTAGTAMTANAAATITVDNADPARDENKTGVEAYVAYKIFDAVKEDNASVSTTGTTQTIEGAIAYKISSTSPWFSILFNADGSAKAGNEWFTATAIIGEEDMYQVIPTDKTKGLTDAKVIADWLYEKAPKDNNGKLTITGGTELTVGQSNTVNDGYYLVTSSLGTMLGLATTDIPMTIVEKNDYPSIDKKQNDVSANDTYKDAIVSVGVTDTIWYSVDVVVPATAKGVLTVTDTMSAGLDYDATTGLAWSISGDGTITANDYTVVEKTANDTWTWKATINANERTLGKTVTIKYAAIVNDKAIVVDTDKQNEVRLDYSNYTQSDFVEYQNYATGAIKYDGATATKDENNVLVLAEGATKIKYLKDAEFKLQVSGQDKAVVLVNDNSGVYYRPAVAGEEDKVVAIKSDDNGQIMIRGLDVQKNYTLLETKAPDGYNLLTNPVTLSLTLDTKNKVSVDVVTEADQDKNTTYLVPADVVKIENLQGVLLPSTGGIGTTIFYIIGGLLIVAAAVFFVVRRKAE